MKSLLMNLLLVYLVIDKLNTMKQYQELEALVASYEPNLKNKILAVIKSKL